MKTANLDVDVAIVGGSLAGCAAAKLLGQQGLRVAVLEQHADPAHYKKLCGHYVQAGAMPALRRLGLCEPIEARGGVRTGIDVRTPFGWIPRSPTAHGYSIRRRTLDPLLRAQACATPGVEWLGGMRAIQLSRDGSGVAGVVGRDPSGHGVEVRARLVIGADGRDSAVARLAGVPVRSWPNERFAYFTYYAGLPESGRIWRLDGDVVFSLPNDGDVTLVAVMARKPLLPAFKTDIRASFASLVGALPDAPRIDAAQRVAPFRGYVDYPNRWRAPAPRPGLALIGDAALSLDPVPGVGCGWALMSAMWLVDAVAPVLAAGRDAAALDPALAGYARQHAEELDEHRDVIVEQSRAEPPTLIQRTLARAATRDRATAERLAAVNTRSAPPRSLRRPRTLLRAAIVATAALASVAPAAQAGLIVWQHGSAIHVMRDDGTHRKRLLRASEVPGASSIARPHVASDGTTVVFERRSSARSGNGISKLEAGTVVSRLTAPAGPGQDLDPEVAGASGRIVYAHVAGTQGVPAGDIRSLSLTGGDQQLVVPRCRGIGDLAADPSANPIDPAQVVYGGCEDSASASRLIVSRPDRVDERMMHIDDAPIVDPSFAPDGSAIVAAEGGGLPGLWIYPMGAGEPQRVVATPPGALPSSPRLIEGGNPQAERLLFAMHGDLWSVAVADCPCVFPAGAKRLTTDGAAVSDGSPAWTARTRLGPTVRRRAATNHQPRRIR